ncbi:MAG TPA: alpha/beta hydrolase [Candidatus Limnocylindrales bacterium]|nr:alpha/beta hydrolase [Candidatus Limnocylindrales bacterium]
MTFGDPPELSPDAAAPHPPELSPDPAAPHPLDPIAVVRPDLSPDPAAEPDQLQVTVDTGDRIAFLDWGGPTRPEAIAGPSLPPLLLVHGLSRTAWSWTPIARRLRTVTRVIAPDLRGHGASESPREGYDLESLAFDMLTVLTACGVGSAVVAGHGFGALVAATMATLRPETVVGLALLDAGWERAEDETGMDAPELLRSLQEPPEVLASMEAYLADRRDWDPATWDADEERAARSAVDEKHQGRVVPVVRRWALAGCVEAMFSYRPASALARYPGATLIAIAEPGGADDEEARERRVALDEQLTARTRAGLPAARVVRFAGVGHDLMRYRPDALAQQLFELLRAG